MTRQLELLKPWISLNWWYKGEVSETKLFHKCALALIRANSKETLNGDDIKNYILENCRYDSDNEYWQNKAKHFSSLVVSFSEFMRDTDL